jgi:hypothetical protein
MLIENGKITPLGLVVGVVAVGAIIYTGKKLLWDESEEDTLAAATATSNEKIASLQAENWGIKAQAEVALAKGEVALAKADILNFTNEKRKLSLDEMQEKLLRKEQDVANDIKALAALEKRVKAMATP